MAFEVGNERRVKFWKDRWYGDEPLCMTFLSLFALASSKKAWVAMWEDQVEEGHWDPCFDGHLND